MKTRTSSRIAGACVVAGFALGGYSAQSQVLPINYERLSSLEEPLSTNIAGWTAVVTGLVDVSATHDFDDDDHVQGDLIANGEVSIERQLPNRWTANVFYFAQIEADMDELADRRVRGDSGDFTDSIAASLRNEWGAVVVGNVSGLVREETRRRRGAGNAALRFDDSIGTLDEWSAGYRGRFGPVVVAGVVDREGGYTIGGSYQRPLNDRDYRFTARYVSGEYTAEDESTTFDTHGVSVLGEMTYGSLIVDAGVGYDRLDDGAVDADRIYGTLGARYKWGAVSVSAEGLYGQIDGQDERAASFGVGYDIARGLSANVGVNHAVSEVRVDGVQVTDTETTTVTGSMRYSF